MGVPEGIARIGGQIEFAAERFVLLLQFERGAVGGVVRLGLGFRVGKRGGGVLCVFEGGGAPCAG